MHRAVPCLLFTRLHRGYPLAWRLVVGLGLLLALRPLSRAADAPPPVLRVGIETASEPFTFADASGRPTGFAYELFAAVAADQHLPVQYVLLPWGELLEQFKAGKIDIICNVVHTPERRSFLEFSSTTILMRGAVYLNRNAPPLHSVADLAGRRVATGRNSRSHEYLRHKEWGVELVFFDTMMQCVDAVHEGRADLFLGTRLVTDYQLRQRGYRDVVPGPLLFPDFDFREHFGVQPGRAALLAQLNDGILNVQRSGTYDQLYEKWIGPIEPRSLRWRDVQPYMLPAILVLLAVLGGLVWQRHLLARMTRQAEALRRSEEQLSLVIEGSSDAFWDWEVRSDAVTRSPRWGEMLGYPPGTVPATHAAFLELVHPDDRVRVEAQEHSVWHGLDRFEVEFRLRGKSGEWIWVLDRGKVVARDPATGEPWRVAGTQTDISPRKRAEEDNEKLNRKMLEAQKLESLGVLAGGIAHDFNNVLTVILGNASLRHLEPNLSAGEREGLGTIVTAARRAADLCRQLLAYAGKGAFVIERLDLNRVTQDTARLLELSVHTCTLDFDLAPSLPSIEADASQIRQIIMNLVLNAAEAITEPPGRIRIVTAVRTVREGDLPNALPAGTRVSGEFVRLEISDNGAGMPPEVLGRIFDPFFTTKFTGRGLGLAAVLGIVRSHHGALTVESTVGRGSVFRIYFPAVAGAPTRPASSPPFADETKGAGTILVADDEDAVRWVVASALRRTGFEVVEAVSGEEALQKFLAEPARFHVVVLDITMPGMDGLSTLRRMRERRPELPCVIVSGHSEKDAAGVLGRDGDESTAFLQKPFELVALTRALAGVRAGAAESSQAKDAKV